MKRLQILMKLSMTFCLVILFAFSMQAQAKMQKATKTPPERVQKAQKQTVEQAAIMAEKERLEREALQKTVEKATPTKDYVGEVVKIVQPDYSIFNNPKVAQIKQMDETQVASYLEELKNDSNPKVRAYAESVLRKMNKQ